MITPVQYRRETSRDRRHEKAQYHCRRQYRQMLLLSTKVILFYIHLFICILYIFLL